MKKNFITVIIILLSTSFCFAAGPKNIDDLNIKSGSVKINNQWRLTFQNDYLADFEGQDLCFTHSTMGLVNYGLINGLEFGLNYRQAYQKTEDDPWKPDGRPHFNVRLKGKILAFEISNGTGFEFRRQQEEKNYWEYRNNLAVKFPQLFNSIKLQPYIAYNFFTVLGTDSEITRNGFSYGASLRLSKNFFSDFYYSSQVSRYDDTISNFEIFGTSLRYLF